MVEDASSNMIGPQLEINPTLMAQTAFNLIERILNPDENQDENQDENIQVYQSNNLQPNNYNYNTNDDVDNDDTDDDDADNILQPLSYGYILHDIIFNRYNSSRERQLQIIINNTLHDRNIYKQVISEEGKNDLTEVVFRKQNSNNYNLRNNTDNTTHTTCPIYQTDFEDGEKITKLPCNHYFNSEAIMKWLSKEKACCPVCRYELKSIELKDENTEEEEEDEDEEEEDEDEDEDEEEDEDEDEEEEEENHEPPRQRRRFNSSQSSTIPQTTMDVLNSEIANNIYEHEESDLQEAILDSLINSQNQ